MENVWDYPRPPALVPDERRVRIEHAGVVVADTTRALRILETSHPPTYDLPPGDVALELLVPSPGRRAARPPRVLPEPRRRLLGRRRAG